MPLILAQFSSDPISQEERFDAILFLAGCYVSSCLSTVLATISLDNYHIYDAFWVCFLRRKKHVHTLTWFNQKRKRGVHQDGDKLQVCSAATYKLWVFLLILHSILPLENLNNWNLASLFSPWSWHRMGAPSMAASWCASASVTKVVSSILWPLCSFVFVSQKGLFFS